MANGFEKSLAPLIIENEATDPLSFQPVSENKGLTDSVPVSKDLTDPPPTKEFSESPEPIPEKKSWFKKKKDESGKKKEESYPAVNPVKIFRFSSVIEALLMCLGLLAALIQGGAFPFIFLAIGEVLDSFFKFQTVSSGCSTNFFANTSSTGTIEPNEIS